MADERAQRVSAWLDDGQVDAQLLATHPSVRNALGARYDVGQPRKYSPASLLELTAFLDEMAKWYTYAGVYVLDRDAQVVAQSSRGKPLDPLFSETCRAVARSKVMRIDLVGDAPNRSLMGFGAPVFPGTGATHAGGPPGQLLGIVLVVSDASQTLFPLVTREVVPTRTGETILVRREGDEIIFFSPLRHVPAGSPNLRIPLSVAPRPARLALEGRETFVEYNDYRGVPVLAATQYIPLTGWGLVRKIDRAEALTDFRGRAVAEWLAGGLLVILLGSLLMFYRRDVMTRISKQEEKKFQALLESPLDVMIVIDRTGHIVYANSATEEMFGYELEELLGKTFLTLVPERFRAESAEYYARLFSNPSLHDRQMQQDRWGLRKDGSEFPAEVTSTPIETLQGAVVAIAVRDITERKRAEAEHTRLVTAIEQSAEAVVITDTDGSIEYVNPAFTRITGYSREEALGQNPRMLKSGKHDLAFYQQLWATILKGEIWRGEIVNRRKDGSFYTEEMSIAPVRSTHGEVTHYIATKEDVTKRKSMEAQLRQVLKMEAIGQLAGGVAHDFNNLLTIISGYGHLLRERLGPQDLDHVEEILKASDRATALTRQLLAFSRRQILTPQVLDLNSVVADLEKMLRRLIGENIELTTVQQSGLGRVKADPGQVEQVIINLAVNARDAMPEGGKLTIETANVDLDGAYARRHAGAVPGRYVMVAVSDTGIGMNAETLAHMFEPFFTTKEKGKGTGLGLATVYGIVKQSVGYTAVYSEPGHGSTFKIYLPRVEQAMTKAESAGRGPELARGSETVLVAEDEESVRSLVCETLESLGYKVLEAREPGEALTIVEQYTEPIHLLLTDVVMPQMSGKELAKRLATARPEAKVLYMSGYTDNAVFIHGVLEAGRFFLQKPFAPGTLLRKVREVLDTKPEDQR
jgi:PAS domain S-box-containing protein